MFAIELLDVYAALDVYVEDYVLSVLQLFLHLTFQGSIVTVGIYFLVFQEFIGINLGLELFRSKEEVLYTMLLCASWRARCSAYAEY